MKCTTIDQIGQVALPILLAGGVFLGAVAQSQSAEEHASDAIPAGSVFEFEKVHKAQFRVAAALRDGDIDQSIERLKILIAAYPDNANNYALLAMAQARQGRRDAALVSLGRAIDRGFASFDVIRQYPEYTKLKADARFRALERLVAENNAAGKHAISGIQGARVEDGIATVDEANTVLDTRTNLLRSKFAFLKAAEAPQQAIAGTSEWGIAINELFSNGKAAGNIGDLYDNRDRKHSVLSPVFSQLGNIDYATAAVTNAVDYGLNNKILFSAPTIGNASLGIKGAHSLARLATANQREATILYLQYRENHMYVYPSVNDFEGVDRFEAKTPYLVVSRGRSGSDRALMQAMVAALAALKPAVKERLIATRLLMPTLQVLLRRSMEGIEDDADYLSPKAHPIAFDPKQVDLLRIVKLANGLETDNLPPLVSLRVVEESGVPLRGDAETVSNGALFSTPQALARIHTERHAPKRMVLQTQIQAVGKPKNVRLHWVLLEGDANRVLIKPKSGAAGLVELTVEWHDPRPSLVDPDVTTRRVDIGVFAVSDSVISAPAFVSIYFPLRTGHNPAADLMR